ncbi:MAG: Lrp/AsnC family transcriptional regulator [Candidatus Micrarchaeota archaeon]|nr:Lrp/AsnC family transcriptional regulator [Candidatus Micrarchaeota archaeon]
MALKIDEKDRQILRILQEDSRTPNELIGRKVGLSEAATRRRIKNLLKQGIIRRFTIDVAESQTVSALVLLSLSPQANIEKVVQHLLKQEGIESIWEISGEIDVALIIGAPDISSLNSRIDKIRMVAGVTKTQTCVVLKKRK